MKRLFVLAAAATSAFALNIAVVDLREVVAKSPESKTITEKLQKEFKGRENDIIALDKTINDATAKLKKDMAVMSETDRAKAERDIVAKQRDLQRLQAEYRDDSQVRQQEEMQKLLTKVRDKINGVAQAEKLDLILHTDAAPFASKALDVTDKVIASMKG